MSVRNPPSPCSCRPPQGRRELPPVRQLAGDHVVSFDAELGEAERNAVDARGELAIAQAALTSGDRVEIDHGGFVRQFRAAAVEVIAHHLVTPMALRSHRVDARLGQNGIEPHLAPSARRWDRFLTQIKDGYAVSPHGYG